MQNSKHNISIIGLGYVGLPLAVKFSQKYNVTGFDLSQNRIQELKAGIDKTYELSKKDLELLNNIHLTSNENDISKSNIYIITVPTPVDKNNKPDLFPLLNATGTVGRYLSKNDIVIFESTVFPGCTEEICAPELEKKSGLKYNLEFFCGYSPERINPGDKKHTLTKITKVVSASNRRVLLVVDDLYNSIIDAGLLKFHQLQLQKLLK